MFLIIFFFCLFCCWGWAQPRNTFPCEFMNPIHFLAHQKRAMVKKIFSCIYLFLLLRNIFLLFYYALMWGTISLRQVCHVFLLFLTLLFYENFGVPHFGCTKIKFLSQLLFPKDSWFISYTLRLFMQLFIFMILIIGNLSLF